MRDCIDFAKFARFACRTPAGRALKNVDFCAACRLDTFLSLIGHLLLPRRHQPRNACQEASNVGRLLAGREARRRGRYAKWPRRNRLSALWRAAYFSVVMTKHQFRQKREMNETAIDDWRVVREIFLYRRRYQRKTYRNE